MRKIAIRNDLFYNFSAMPYLGMHEFLSPTVREMLNGYDIRNLPNPQTAELTVKHDNRVIGQGCECVVINIGGNPERVAALYRRGISPSQAKQIYYLHKIFSALFPFNFSPFHAAFGCNNSEAQGLTGNVRVKVEKPAEFRILLDSLLRLSTRYEPQYPFADVLRVVSKYNFPVSFDRCKKNFIIGRNGGEYYVDTIWLTNSLGDHPAWDIDGTKDLLKSYERTTGDTVIHSLNRLASLNIIQLRSG